MAEGGITRSIAGGSRSVAFSRMLKILFGLAASVAIAFAAAEDADAQSVMADSDGYVPVTYSCWAGNEVGLYSWYFDGYTTTGTITINQCLLDSMGAGPGDYQAVIDHEMGHALGYGHSHDPYSTMYPVTTITGGRKRYVTIRKIRPNPPGDK